ncbi:hypothetical protein C8F01DRAFT_1045050 [Mycena amicta]|nr:hypothetical protein C8F01DRAFT_1045050 [Mycena amicta]
MLHLFLTLLSFLPLVAAVDGVLFTSSVTYCSPPATLLIQQFDLKYFAKNQSIFFNISAASVESNVNVSANIALKAYGLTLVNVTVDLCDLLAGVLCPLPTVEFVGSESISLPNSLGVSKRIPEIAFRIPDLEAYAELTLIEVDTHEVKACVQATLSNGWSTHQPAVEWATGALSLSLLLGGIWQTMRSDPLPLLPHRLLDLFRLFQFIATSGFLSLNYPLLYRAFTLNFAFSLGLISSSTIENGIDNMRTRTGGTMPNSSSTSAVGLVDRKLSPWSTNLQLPLSSTQSLLSDLSDSTPTNLTISRLAFVGGLHQFDSTAGQVQTVTDSSSNVLEAGIPIYVNSMHIATANAFDTMFLVGLMCLAIAMTIAAILYGVRLLADRVEWGSEELRRRCRTSYPTFVWAWALRLGLIALPPALILSFYQWTLKDSWLSTLFSVMTVLGVSSMVIYPAYRTFRLVHHHSTSILDETPPHTTMHGPLHDRFRSPRYYFFAVFLAAVFLRAIVLAAGQGHGMSQVIVCMLIELAVIIAHVLFKPFTTRGGDVFSAYFGIVRLVCTGLMIAFVESVNVDAIPRVAIGAVIAVILSIAILVLLSNIVLSVVRLLRRNRVRQPPVDVSTVEKGGPASPILAKSTMAGQSQSPSLTTTSMTIRHSSSSQLSQISNVPTSI